MAAAEVGMPHEIGLVLRHDHVRRRFLNRELLRAVVSTTLAAIWAGSRQSSLPFESHVIALLIIPTTLVGSGYGQSPTVRTPPLHPSTVTTAFVNVAVIPIVLVKRDRIAAWGLTDQVPVSRVTKRADALLLNGNPMKDITYTRQLAGGMLGGRWLARNELDRRIAVIDAVETVWGRAWPASDRLSLAPVRRPRNVADTNKPHSALYG